MIGFVRKAVNLYGSVNAQQQFSPWNRTTKVIVVVFGLLLVLWLMARFRTLIGMLVIAAILGYLLEPVINFINQRTTLRRGLIITLVYVTLAAVVLGGFLPSVSPLTNKSAV